MFNKRGKRFLEMHRFLAAQSLFPSFLPICSAFAIWLKLSGCLHPLSLSPCSVVCAALNRLGLETEGLGQGESQQPFSSQLGDTPPKREPPRTSARTPLTRNPPPPPPKKKKGGPIILENDARKSMPPFHFVYI